MKQCHHANAIIGGSDDDYDEDFDGESESQELSAMEKKLLGWACPY